MVAPSQEPQESGGGFSTQPDQLGLPPYRDLLRTILIQLDESDWRVFRTDNSVLNTVEVGLREVLQHIDRMRELTPGNDIHLDIIQSALKKARVALYVASDLASVTDVHQINQFYDQINLCRNYL